MAIIGFIVLVVCAAVAIIYGLIGLVLCAIWERKLGGGTIACIVVLAFGVLMADMAYLNAPFNVVMK